MVKDQQFNGVTLKKLVFQGLFKARFIEHPFPLQREHHQYIPIDQSEYSQKSRFNSNEKSLICHEFRMRYGIKYCTQLQFNVLLNFQGLSFFTQSLVLMILYNHCLLQGVIYGAETHQYLIIEQNLSLILLHSSDSILLASPNSSKSIQFHTSIKMKYFTKTKLMLKHSEVILIPSSIQSQK
ncbi:hypothetical protein ABPG74_002309 [Tetrahymena malaccensis]